jgi:hypothetical protein
MPGWAPAAATKTNNPSREANKNVSIQRVYRPDDEVPDEFHVSVEITVHDGRHALALDQLLNHIKLLSYASESSLDDPEVLWLLHQRKKDKNLSQVDDLREFLVATLLQDVDLLAHGVAAIASFLPIREMVGEELPSRILTVLQRSVPYLGFEESEEE